MHVKSSDMKYTSQSKQLTIDEFRSSLEGLSKSNRWVQLGDLLPWAKIEKLYNSKLNNGKKGAGNKPARMIIGATIIKKKLSLSDAETIQMIQENPYMQYFVGLTEFTDKPIFDPSLFVTIRKRLGEEDFNEMSVALLEKQIKMQEDAERRKKESESEDDDKPQTPGQSDSTHDFGEEFTDSQDRIHKGVLKIDATCSNAEVRYPVDVDIIHDGCKTINRYIATLCMALSLPLPECHYKSARFEYLNLIKKKTKKTSEIKSTKRMLLYYLKHDIQSFVNLVSPNTERLDTFMRNERNTVGAIIKMYYQQMEMLQQGTHQCADRIISIFQPHIRPIVRGKAKAKVEFGAKIGASIVNGYTFVDHLSWDAYNEESDVELQIKLYKERFGYLPATVLCDKIYMNRANRQLFKEYEIASYCKPLGRPKKEPKTPEELSKMAQAVGDRNEIEASFGTGKRVYRADNIRAKLPETAASWIGSCYFVKNVMKFLRELCLVLSEIWLILKNLFTPGAFVCRPLSVMN